MPHHFNVTITDTKTEQTEQLSGDFPDPEWAQLLQYLDASFRLADCRFAETRSQLSLNVSWKQGEQVAFKAGLPPEDDIAAFLLRMRPFILQKEPTYFFKIRKILMQHIALPSARRYLDGLADRYTGKKIPMMIEVSSQAGTLSLTSDEAIKKWLNAFEYHQLPKERVELLAMYEVFPENSARVLFLYAMLERASAIGKMGALIDGLKQRDGAKKDLRW